MKRGAFNGKPGRFWVVRGFVGTEWLYWTGMIDERYESGQLYSHDRRAAAQFLSEQSANFAADMMGGPGRPRRVEEEIFPVLVAE